MARFRKGTTNYNNGVFNWGDTPSLDRSNHRTGYKMVTPRFRENALNPNKASHTGPGQGSLTTGDDLRARSKVSKRMPR